MQVNFKEESKETPERLLREQPSANSPFPYLIEGRFDDPSLASPISEGEAWGLGLLLQPGFLVEDRANFPTTRLGLPAIFGGREIKELGELVVRSVMWELGGLVGVSPGCRSRFEEIFRRVYWVLKNGQLLVKGKIGCRVKQLTQDPGVRPIVPETFRGLVPQSVINANRFVAHIRYQVALDIVRDTVNAIRDDRPGHWIAAWRSIIQECCDQLWIHLVHIRDLEGSCRHTIV